MHYCELFTAHWWHAIFIPPSFSVLLSFYYYDLAYFVSDAETKTVRLRTPYITPKINKWLHSYPTYNYFETVKTIANDPVTINPLKQTGTVRIIQAKLVHRTLSRPNLSGPASSKTILVQDQGCPGQGWPGPRLSKPRLSMTQVDQVISSRYNLTKQFINLPIPSSSKSMTNESHIEYLILWWFSPAFVSYSRTKRSMSCLFISSTTC